MGQVQYRDPPLPDMIDGEWRSPLVDEKGRLIVVGGGTGGASTVDQGAAGAQNWKVVEANSAAIKTAVEAVNTKTPSDPATAAKQDAQQTALDAIKTATLIGTGWFPSQLVKYTSIPGGGIDLTTAVPGKTCIAILASRTTANGSVLVVRPKDNTGSDMIDLGFGANYEHYGQWGFVSDTSTGCVPFYALFV